MTYNVSMGTLNLTIPIPYEQVFVLYISVTVLAVLLSVAVEWSLTSKTLEDKLGFVFGIE